MQPLNIVSPSTIYLLAAAAGLVNGRSVAIFRSHSISGRAPISVNINECPIDSPLCISSGCTSTLIGLDTSNCEGDGLECSASQLCVAGTCKTITLTEDRARECPEECSTGQFCNSQGDCEAIQLHQMSALFVGPFRNHMNLDLCASHSTWRRGQAIAGQKQHCAIRDPGTFWAPAYLFRPGTDLSDASQNQTILSTTVATMVLADP